MNPIANLSFNLIIDEDFIFYLGKGMKTTSHSNPTITIIISERENFEIRTQNQFISSNFLILPANFKHSFSLSKDGKVAMFFLEQTSKTAGLIKSKFNLGSSTVLNLKKSEYQFDESLLFKQINIKTNKINLDKLFEFKKNPLPTSIDTRVLQTVQLLLDDRNSMNADEIFEKVYISKSRMRYLFKKEMGVSLSKYIRWSKLRAAGIDIMNGVNFTDACYAKGFYDPSHFNRVFNEMFGVNPSQVLK